MQREILFELFPCPGDWFVSGTTYAIFSKTITVDWPDPKAEPKEGVVRLTISASIKDVNGIVFIKKKDKYYVANMSESSAEYMTKLQSFGWRLNEEAAKIHRYPRAS